MSTNTNDPTKPARGSARARSSTKTTKVTPQESVAPTLLNLARRGKGFSLEGLERRLVALELDGYIIEREAREWRYLRDGNVRFVDRGNIVDIQDAHDRESVRAALLVAARKWGRSPPPATGGSLGWSARWPRN